jgi:mannan endo-1,4-beta-mannosidase
MLKKLLFLVAFTLIVGAAIFFAGQERRRPRRDARPGFVSTRGAQFVIDNQAFRFVGANVSVMYREEDRQLMPETLRAASSDGLRVVRVWAFGEGGEESNVKAIGGDRNDWPRLHPFRRAPNEWNEEAFVHLDRVLAEAARNNLRVQLCLTNWWRDTGGVTQYLKWAGIEDAADDSKPYGINVDSAMQFYTNDVTRRLYREHVEKIVTRRNTITGVLYRDDPVIMGYELMNEAQAPTGRWPERRAWVAEMSTYIKSLDPDHLVTPGTWGYRSAVERREWLEEHRLPNIDFCDVHNYPRDDTDVYVESTQALREFIDNRAAASFALDKPLVFGEFGMGPEGYRGIPETEWYRAFFDGAAQAGVGGAMFWILTPDPRRGYGITYTTPRDEPVRAEIRKASELFASLQNSSPPAPLLDASQHLIPRQFDFKQPPNTPTTTPESVPLNDDGETLYLFKPEMAVSGRFEKLGGGQGYIWGSGMGFFEYVVPARDNWRRVGKIVVRVHAQPTLPWDAHPPAVATRLTLLINGTDCGSRLIPIEDPKHAVTQEWVVTSLGLRLRAARGLPLSIRFTIKPDADLPYGLNISNYPEGYSDKEVRPIQVEVR